MCSSDLMIRLAQIRHQYSALSQGDYQTLQVQPEWIAFQRQAAGQEALVLVNQSKDLQTCQLKRPGVWLDVLNNERLRLQEPLPIFASWGRILVRQS